MSASQKIIAANMCILQIHSHKSPWKHAEDHIDSQSWQLIVAVKYIMHS